MTKISIYNIDEKVLGNDKWIGSDAQNHYATKNFTPTKLAAYFNENQIIDVGSPIRYRYDILEIGDTRLPGTITFNPQVGTPYSFSDISTFLLSKYTLKGNDVTEYLNFLIGTKILFSKSSDINKFGYFKVINIEEYLPEPNFFQVTLEYVTGNGSIEEDRDYLISLIDVLSGDTVTPTLDQVTTAGDTTGNSIILTNPYTLDYTLTNTLTSLNSYFTFVSPTQTEYTADYAGYGIMLNNQFEGIVKDIQIYDSNISLNWNNGTLYSSILNETTPSWSSIGTYYGSAGNVSSSILKSGNGYSLLSLYKSPTKGGSIYVSNLNNVVDLEFPDKPAGTYTIATTEDTPDLSGYVPYIGATTDLDLGTHSITAESFIKNEGTSLQFLKADGSIDSNLYAIDSNVVHKTGNETINGLKTFNSKLTVVDEIISYTKITSSGNIVASGNVIASGNVTASGNISALGNITGASIIKNGGVSTQFLKADGSVDNNIYLTSADLPSTLELYATTAASDIPGYTVLVRNISDSRFNTTAVDVSTGVITTTEQLVGQLVSDANIISGNPGVFNITTIGNISRTSGTGQADFYFRVYKRDNLGIETFITESDKTLPVINGGYSEFSATALWNDGVFLDTDRVVLKYYADRLTSPVGSNPTYNFQFGGLNPVRSTAAIPVAVIPNIYLRDLADVENVDPLDNEVLYWNETASLWEHSSVIGLMPEATAVDDGYLSATDWNTFNDKANANTELNIRRTGYTVYNEFLSSLTNGSYAQTVILGGTVVSASGLVDSNHFGVVGHRSTSTVNSGVYSALNPSAAVHFSCTLVANLQTDLIFKTPPTIAPMGTIRFGIGSGSISFTEYASGFYFEITGDSLVGKTANVSVRSSTPSYTILDDTWYHLRIIATSITLITYYVYDMDGVLLFSATLDTNLPNTTIVMNNSVISTHGGTVATTLAYLDLISITFPSMVRGALN